MTATAYDPWQGVEAYDQPPAEPAAPDQPQSPDRPAADELGAFLAAVDADHDTDWLIPDVLARRDRLIITGEEGVGKMTLLRQIAVMCAAGLHPFTQQDIEPLRTLIVDAQDTPEQVRPEMRPLAALAADRYKPDPGLHIVCRPEGIDLFDTAEAEWLRNLTTSIRPDLICIGPLYRLADGDPTEERSAKAVAAHLDRLRADSGAALLIEAHVPHAQGPKSPRPIRPYGWSGWLRWPEIGVFLAKTGQLEHWRPPRGHRAWPAALTRGGTWPWTVAPASPPGRHDDEDWPPARVKLLQAIEAAQGDARTGVQLVDWIKEVHGHGLARPTWSRELGWLVDNGYADRIDPSSPGRPALWLILPEEAAA